MIFIRCEDGFIVNASAIAMMYRVDSNAMMLLNVGHETGNKVLFASCGSPENAQRVLDEVASKMTGPAVLSMSNNLPTDKGSAR